MLPLPSARRPTFGASPHRGACVPCGLTEALTERPPASCLNPHSRPLRPTVPALPPRGPRLAVRAAMLRATLGCAPKGGTYSGRGTWHVVCGLFLVSRGRSSRTSRLRGMLCVAWQASFHYLKAALLDEKSAQVRRASTVALSLPLPTVPTVSGGILCRMRSYPCRAAQLCRILAGHRDRGPLWGLHGVPHNCTLQHNLRTCLADSALPSGIGASELERGISCGPASRPARYLSAQYHR